MGDATYQPRHNFYLVRFTQMLFYLRALLLRVRLEDGDLDILRHVTERCDLMLGPFARLMSVQAEKAQCLSLEPDRCDDHSPGPKTLQNIADRSQTDVLKSVVDDHGFTAIQV